MKIAVALSGGVDSATSLYLLKKEGHDLFGLFMKNWEEEEGECHSLEDAEDARKVAELLDIPFYTVNFAKEYWDLVFAHFLNEMKLGYTPNPDILCNREIKFKVLFEKATALGADLLATGHYCRTSSGALFKGLDPEKDQSYFLYAVKEPILKSLLFPIGNLEKQEVRRIAKEGALPLFNKKDSTGICFIGKRNFKSFIERYIPHEEGVIETLDGKILGRHEGIFYYTIGQRKGLGIGGPGEPYFVVRKEKESRKLIVAQGENHPALFAKSLLANEVTWIGEAPSFPLRCAAKIRYRQSDQSCRVEKNGDEFLVRFDQPQRAITPRQSVVFYSGEHCLGGGIIKEALE